MDSAFNYAVKLLTRKRYSSEELRRKLQKKFEIEENEVDDIIQRLKIYSYINDDNYREDFSISMLKKGHGINYIVNKLNQKGIKTESIRSDLENIEVEHGLNEHNSAKALILKKIRHIDNMELKEPKTFAKLFNYLYNRGFKKRTVYEVLKEVLKDESNFS